MSKRIKSITILKDFPGNRTWEVGKTYAISEVLSHPKNLRDPLFEFDTFPDIFQINYETLLKRPDGSLISEPEGGTEIWIISQYDSYFPFLENDEWNSNSHYLNTLLKEGRIFLIQDKHLAEKKAKMLKKQLEIQYEIDRLNAEEGWVADWNNLNQFKKYFLYNLEYQKIETYWNTVWRSDKDYMSEKTAETILAKYSQSDLKAYLGIIE